MNPSQKSCRSGPNSFHKFGFNPDEPLIFHQLLNNRLGIMSIERRLPRIPLKEMEDIRFVAISCETVVNRAGFEFSESCGLGIDCFKGICVLWFDVDGAEDDEFVFGDFRELLEEFSLIEVGHDEDILKVLFESGMLPK